MSEMTRRSFLKILDTLEVEAIMNKVVPLSVYDEIEVVAQFDTARFSSRGLIRETNYMCEVGGPIICRVKVMLLDPKWQA